MNAAALMALIEALFQAAPQLVALYGELKSGGTVTIEQVDAVLAQYAALRSQTLADIAAEQAKGD
jgi:hypothetical protein